MNRETALRYALEDRIEALQKFLDRGNLASLRIPFLKKELEC